jgi:hypothetical protein
MIIHFIFQFIDLNFLDLLIVFINQLFNFILILIIILINFISFFKLIIAIILLFFHSNLILIKAD